MGAGQTKSVIPTDVARVRVASVLRLDAPYNSQDDANGGSQQKLAPNGAPYDTRFVASTERLATDGGVILCDAWDLNRFMQRPRFLEMHDLYAANGLTRTVLGSVVDAGVEQNLPQEIVGPTGRALVEYVRFARTPYAQEVRSLYDDGHMSDCSVRWDPRTEETRSVTRDDLLRYGDGVQWVATRAEQMELSAVILGADPGALDVTPRGMVTVSPRLREAFENARSAGLKLPELEKRILSRDRAARIIVAVEQAIGDEPEARAAAVAEVIQGGTAAGENGEGTDRGDQREWTDEQRDKATMKKAATAMTGGYDGAGDYSDEHVAAAAAATLHFTGGDTAKAAALHFGMAGAAATGGKPSMAAFHAAVAGAMLGGADETLMEPTDDTDDDLASTVAGSSQENAEVATQGRARGMDVSAAEQVIADLASSMDALDALFAAFGTVRQQIVDNLTLLRNVMSQSLEPDQGQGDKQGEETPDEEQQETPDEENQEQQSGAEGQEQAGDKQPGQGGDQSGKPGTPKKAPPVPPNQQQKKPPTAGQGTPKGPASTDQGGAPGAGSAKPPVPKGKPGPQQQSTGKTPKTAPGQQPSDSDMPPYMQSNKKKPPFSIAKGKSDVVDGGEREPVSDEERAMTEELKELVKAARTVAASLEQALTRAEKLAADEAARTGTTPEPKDEIDELLAQLGLQAGE